MQPSLRVAIVDDHPVVRRGLQSLVDGHPAQLLVVASVKDVQSLLDAQPRADVVLLDLDLGDGVPGSVNVARVLEAGMKVLVLSALGDPPRVRSAIAAGADGYIHKTHEDEDIVAAILEVAAGRSWVSPHLALAILKDTDVGRPALAPRERRVLELYAQGVKLDTVARHLGIASSTAKEYLERVKRKYADQGRPAQTKLELHRRAIEDGILDSDQS